MNAPAAGAAPGVERGALAKGPFMGAHLEPHVQECLELCQLCEQTCLHCATHCLGMGEDHAHPGHQNLLRDCAEACALAGRFLARMSDRSGLVCGLALELCERCAESCEEMGEDDRVMARCADVCRMCASACEQMVCVCEEGETEGKGEAGEFEENEVGEVEEGDATDEGGEEEVQGWGAVGGRHPDEEDPKHGAEPARRFSRGLEGRGPEGSRRDGRMRDSEYGAFGFGGGEEVPTAQDFDEYRGFERGN